MALLWYVWTSTKSLPLVGLTQAAVIAPSLVVGPLAGVYADRLNRRNLMIASSLFQGGITGMISALYILGVLNVPPMILLILLLYSGAEFYRAANGAMIPSIVPRENLGAANGLFTLSTSANQLASYTIGGIAVASLGIALSITYDSLTFFAAAVIILFITRAYGNPRAEGVLGTPQSRPGFWEEFRSGLAYIRKNRLFLELSVFGLVANFFGAGFSVLTTAYVQVQLGGDVSQYGIVLASLALGVIIGSVVVGKVNFRAYVGKLLFLGVFSFGPLAFLAASANSVPEGVLVFFALGAISGVVNLPIQVLVQTQVPRELLGRAGTVLRALLGIATPIAALTFGFLAGASSVRFVFEVTGVAIALMTALLYVPFKELRDAKY